MWLPDQTPFQKAEIETGHINKTAAFPDSRFRVAKINASRHSDSYFFMGRLLGREQRALTTYKNAFLMSFDVSPGDAFGSLCGGGGSLGKPGGEVALHLALTSLRRLGQLAAGHTVKESQFNVLRRRHTFLLAHGK